MESTHEIDEIEEHDRSGRARRRNRRWEAKMRRHGGGGDWGGPRGRRMRRGDVRLAILRALADGPGHGYELIHRLEEASDGLWRPSPGSVYPTLQLLEDEGLARAEARDGKRIYELTDEGRAEVARRADEAATPLAGAHDTRPLRKEFAALAVAMQQVERAGDADQAVRAAEALAAARKTLYGILAED